MKKYIFILSLLSSIFIISCNDFKDIHEAYVANGETYYAPKVDSAAVLSGKNRVIVKTWYTNATTLKSTIVYWNNRKDSAVFNLTGLKGGKEIQSLNIPNMKEGYYNFEIFNRNAFGDKSLTYTIFGSSYGAEYQDRIKNLPLLSTKSKGLGFTINWGLPVAGFVFSEIKFTDPTSQKEVIQNGGKTQTSSFNSRPSNGFFSYRSAYIPENTAIDTFYTDYLTVPLGISQYEGMYAETGILVRGTGADEALIADVFLETVDATTLRAQAGKSILDNPAILYQIQINADNTVTIKSDPTASVVIVPQADVPSTYDPVTKTLNLHYEYTTSARRKFDTKLVLKP